MEKSKLKIVHVVLSLDIGGMENVIANIISKIDKKAFTVIVVCLLNKGPLVAKVEKMGAKVLLVKRMVRGFSLLYPYSLLSVLKKEEPDLIHSHSGSWLTAAITSKYTGIPHIYTEHGRHYPDPKLIIFLEGLYSRFTKKIVAVSPMLAGYLKKTLKINSDKIELIENGVDIAHYRPQEKCAAIKNELGLSPDTKVIGIIARLSKVKNHYILLLAFKQIISKKKNVRLLIVGDGPEHLNIENAIKELGLSKYCFLLGERHDIPELLSVMDVFVLPSLSEGTSLSLLQAMSCGKPVIVSKVGGNLKIVKNGVTGFLVPASPPELLAEALGQILTHDHLAKTLGLEARKLIFQKFNLDEMVKKYESLYRWSCR